MSEADEERLVGVETQLAHQGQTIDELSAVISKQWSLLERLERRLERIESRLLEMEGAVAAAGPPEPPPPHY